MEKNIDKENLFCLMQCVENALHPYDNCHYHNTKLIDLIRSLQTDYPDFSPPDDIYKGLDQAKKIIAAAFAVLENSPTEIGGNKWSWDNQELACSLIALQNALRPDLEECD